MVLKKGFLRSDSSHARKRTRDSFFRSSPISEPNPKKRNTYQENCQIQPLLIGARTIVVYVDFKENRQKHLSSRAGYGETLDRPKQIVRKKQQIANHFEKH